MLLPSVQHTLRHCRALTSVLAVALVTASAGACASRDTTPVASATAPLAHPAWTKNAVMYEVNVRQYTPEGTFNAFAKSLPRLKALGVDILWIMPVQPIGQLNRKGSLGSYYSVANYTAVNPEFGNEADFKALVSTAHALGMKVILDWVANHTAFDHAWTTAHKDWYTLKPDGSISRAIDEKGKETDWTDVADLNFNNKAMRAEMISDMKWWVDSTAIDGFRCDAAGLVPYDFWKEASNTLRRSHPDFFMLAEWEDPKLEASFDMTYGWTLHHLLNDVAQGKQGTSALVKFFAADSAAYGVDAYRMDFTSNHDENSWNGSEFERMGDNHLPAYILAATVRNSMPLLYTGQEASLHKRLRFFDKDTVDWSGPSLESFYHDVFALRHAQPALWNGAFGGDQRVLSTTAGERVLAFSRTKDTSTVVVFVNFDSTAHQVTYQGLTPAGAYTDWFSKARLSLEASGTMEVPKHGYRVLVRNVQ